MYKMSAVIVFLFLLVLYPARGLVVNEIMYNPPGTDNKHEWIEVYNNVNETINLTTWKFFEELTNHAINSFQGSPNVGPNSFAIIADNTSIFLQDYPAYNGSLFDSSFSLSNLGEALVLKNSSLAIVESINYTSTAATNGTGKTLCRLPDGGGLQDCDATPGASNTAITNAIINPDAVISISIANVTVLNNSYTSLFSIEIKNKEDCSIEDNVTVNYNITNVTGLVKNETFTRSVGCSATANTGSWTPGTIGNFTLCGRITQTTINETNLTNNEVCSIVSVIDTSAIICNLSLSISGQSAINAEVTSSFSLVLTDSLCNQTAHPVEVFYYIEDLFGNIAKIPQTIEPLISGCSKSSSFEWTPSILSGSEAYHVKANITNSFCNDLSADNNSAFMLIAVKGTTPPNNSSINITGINIGSDNEIKYGESGETSITVYRGNTSQNAVNVFVQNSDETKLSETTNFNLNTRFATYSLNVPIQMKPNCDSSLADGSHTLVVTGLGITETRTISVKGISSSTCKTVTVTSSSGGSSSGGSSGSSSGGAGSSGISSVTQTPNYDILNFNSSVIIGEEFTTKVKITNNFTVHKNFTVYSYVYKGNAPVSLGYNTEANEWKATYTANQRSLGIGPKSSVTIELRNIIENDTEPGTYNFRVRIKLDNKETDLTRQITVTPRVESATEKEAADEQRNTANETNNETQNKTQGGKNTRQTQPTTSITGFAAARSPNYMIFLSPVAILLQFLSSLING